MGSEVAMQGDVETTNLASKFEDLKEQIQQLQQAIFERQSNLEVEIRLAKKQTEEEMGALRAEYDRHIDRGDKQSAEKTLDKISAARGKLVGLAKKITGQSVDFGDLEARTEELRQEVLPLTEAATRNHLKARRLDGDIGGLSWTLTSVSGDIRKLERTVDEAKKVCEQILSE